MKKPLVLTAAAVAALLVIGSLSAKEAPPPALQPAPPAEAAAPTQTAEPTPTRPAPTAAPTMAPLPTRTAVPYPTFAPKAPGAAAPAEPTGGKCADYATQAEAQAALRRDPVRAGRLDDDRDGIACESNPAPFDRAPVARPAR